MSFLAELSQVLLLIVGLLMIVIILLQRGRGGGLAGAFGGMGGQSAFGTRAGDVFTRITGVMAVIWVLLAGGSGWLIDRASHSVSSGYKSASDAAAGSGVLETPDGVMLGEPIIPAGETPSGTPGEAGEPPVMPIEPLVTPDEAAPESPPAADGAAPASPMTEAPDSSSAPPSADAASPPSGTGEPQSDTTPPEDGAQTPPAGESVSPPAND